MTVTLLLRDTTPMPSSSRP